jgi:hypothetical protein
MEPPTNLQSLFKTFDNFIKNMSDSEKNFLILNFGKNLFPNLELNKLLKGDKTVEQSAVINGILILCSPFKPNYNEISNYLFTNALN